MLLNVDLKDDFPLGCGEVKAELFHTETELTTKLDQGRGKGW